MESAKSVTGQPIVPIREEAPLLNTYTEAQGGIEAEESDL